MSWECVRVPMSPKTLASCSFACSSFSCAYSYACTCFACILVFAIRFVWPPLLWAWWVSFLHPQYSTQALEAENLCTDATDLTQKFLWGQTQGPDEWATCRKCGKGQGFGFWRASWTPGNSILRLTADSASPGLDQRQEEDSPAYPESLRPCGRLPPSPFRYFWCWLQPASLFTDPWDSTVFLKIAKTCTCLW